MAARVRAFDWAATPLGPIESWSPALRMVVRMMLVNAHPIILWWGPEYIQIYNDPYRPILGTKAPLALGQPARECWAEIWDVIAPLIDRPFGGGPPTWIEDIHVEIVRYGFPDEGHFTIAYSPVPDESAPGGIGGVLANVHEITEQVVGKRRVTALRDLGARTGESTSAAEACAAAADTLAAHAKDLPFVLLYLISDDGKRATLEGAAGVEPDTPIAPAAVDLDASAGGPWPMALALRTETLQVVEQLGAHFADLPRGPWADPPDAAAVVPIPSNRPHEPAAVMVAGLSSRLRFDDSYRDFLELVRTQIAAAIADARAYAEERRRADALAEIDRAKTAFFSNVSHEFRTPLTLMLGPLEEALAASDLAAAERERIEVAHRNSLRLLKLVNSLLDFSRIEAGRAQASYEATDLAAFTAELASNFRSACERAGLTLSVDCPPLPEPVHVDRDMWEKIVLNLLSNAFKFTFEGNITVRLRVGSGEFGVDSGATGTPGSTTGDDRRNRQNALGAAASDRGSPNSELPTQNSFVTLTVRDSGVGIPQDELPRLFERFHRIEGQRSRTHEGSGIGLALVQELVKLNGGAIRAASTPGRGTAFTIDVPFGTAHLAPDRIGAARTDAPTYVHAETFVEEALRWLPDEESGVGSSELGVRSWELGVKSDERFATPNSELTTPNYELATPNSQLPTPHSQLILVADDNADMRAYLRRVLGANHDIETVADGEAALDAIRARRPDLVLADVMMPGLDGFGLLRAIRADSALRDLPVILLSARAGAEARVEGIAAGANDYLIKPFGTRELIARVDASLERGRLRRQTLREVQAHERRTRELFRQAPGFICILCGPDHVFEFANEAYLRLVGGRDVVGKPLREVLPEAAAQGFLDILDEVYRSGKPYTGSEVFVQLQHSPGGSIKQHFLTFVYQPIADAQARTTGIFVEGFDVTESRRAQAALLKSGKEYNALLESIDEGFCVIEVLFDAENKPFDYRFLQTNPAYERQNGLSDVLGKTVREMGSEREQYWFDNYGKVALTGKSLRFEGKSASLGCWYDIFAFRTGEPGERRVAVLFRDITEHKRTEKAMRRLASIVDSSDDAILSKDLQGNIVTWNRAAERMFGYSAEEARGRFIGDLIIPADRLGEENDILHRLANGEAIDHFETVRMHKDGSTLDISVTISPLFVNGRVVGASKIARDISERKRAERHRELLIHELNHRVKNTLATVQSLALQSLRGAASVKQGQAALESRLLALSKAHDVLTRENWAFAGLRKIVAGAIAPYSIPDRASRFEVEGDALRLSPHAGLALAMALHELATNAVKYGALATEQGLAQDPGGTAELRFEPAGLVCEIAAPLEAIAAHDDGGFSAAARMGERKR